MVEKNYFEMIIIFLVTIENFRIKASSIVPEINDLMLFLWLIKKRVKFENFLPIMLESNLCS